MRRRFGASLSSFSLPPRHQDKLLLSLMLLAGAIDAPPQFIGSSRVAIFHRRSVNTMPPDSAIFTLLRTQAGVKAMAYWRYGLHTLAY